MKVRTDEHISPEIVRAVRDLGLNPEWELTSIYEFGQGGSGDVTWVTEFAKTGGKAIISADKDFHLKPHQVVAVCNTGLIVIQLPPKWQNARRQMQAAHILLWWPRIEKLLLSAPPRTFWRVPWEFDDKGALTRITIDYGKAQQKLKKAQNKNNEVV